MNVISHDEFEVANKSDLAMVRRHIRRLADGIGMSPMKEVQMRTASTELLTNMLRYAGGGRAIIEEVEHESTRGVRALFQDEGPGIADKDAAMTKGFSTGKGLGHGLSGCKNLVDTFDLSSEPGMGTKVVITKWC